MVLLVQHVDERSQLRERVVPQRLPLDLQRETPPPLLRETKTEREREETGEIQRKKE